MSETIVYKKNQKVWYIKNKPVPAIITNIHLDDYPNLYYTILFQDGTEKQTIDKYICYSTL